MKPSEKARGERRTAALTAYDSDVTPLPGIKPLGYLEVLVEQLVESLRRIEFVHHIRDSTISTKRSDPSQDIFDPLRSAVLHLRNGNLDEAYWLVFLATHFGKSASGWALVRDIYGRLGHGKLWNWKSISADPASFRHWLRDNQERLEGRRFSNHRKFESLKADSKKGTAEVLESYVRWVMKYGSHGEMVRTIHKEIGQNPRDAFDFMYRSMDEVLRFGRLGRFDYLTMLGKLGISPIEPGSAYLWHNASGPLAGAKLLFLGDADSVYQARRLDRQLEELDKQLKVGMQTLEDALCNWQKSPGRFISFRG